MVVTVSAASVTGWQKDPATMFRGPQHPITSVLSRTMPKPSIGRVLHTGCMQGRARASDWGSSCYSHLSDANPIILLMKSGCSTNEITLRQPASLHSTAALSIQLARLVGNLHWELRKPPPIHGDRQQVHCQPPQQHRLKSSISSSSCPAQQTAESRVADNDTPSTGFALCCWHDFAPGAAARMCWEGSHGLGQALLGQQLSWAVWCQCWGREVISAPLAATV